MATLQGIAFTLASGSAAGLVCLGLFRQAVVRQSSFVAPRATARPPTVIYNRQASKNDVQDRGGPMWGWIRWVMSMEYDTLLSGVPGTGTRCDGLEGCLLRVNMDGIVLLRFHALCRRLNQIATFLCLCFLLPIYVSAQCYWEADDLCLNETLTDYERTTLNNIPPLTDSDETSNHTSSLQFHYPNGTTNAELTQDQNFRIVARLYVVVLCFWVMVVTTMILLNKEWIQLLAMRRVYYLESNVWEDRKQELEETLNFTGDDLSKTEPHLVHRDPWIPDPEKRDTVPHIGLYSVLVGGLPSMPPEAYQEQRKQQSSNSEDHQPGEHHHETKKLRDHIDWQLSLTAAFFDHCVPNQPGFTSSVAAVTVIPSAHDITLAWKRWYTVASLLRRLRFIQSQITEAKRRVELEEEQLVFTANGQPVVAAQAAPTTKSCDGSELLNVDTRSSDVDPNRADDTGSPSAVADSLLYREVHHRQSLARLREGGLHVADIYDAGLEDQGREASSIELMRPSLPKQQSFKVGVLGPEQDAIYSRELAQSASTCCPNGCGEESARRASREWLVEEEARVLELLQKANEDLREVRRMIAKSPSPQPSNRTISSPRDDESYPRSGEPRIASQPPERKTPRVPSALMEDRLPSSLTLEADLLARIAKAESPRSTRSAASRGSVEVTLTDKQNEVGPEKAVSAVHTSGGSSDVEASDDPATAEPTATPEHADSARVRFHSALETEEAQPLIETIGSDAIPDDAHSEDSTLESAEAAAMRASDNGYQEFADHYVANHLSHTSTINSSAGTGSRVHYNLPKASWDRVKAIVLSTTNSYGSALPSLHRRSQFAVSTGVWTTCSDMLRKGTTNLFAIAKDFRDWLLRQSVETLHVTASESTHAVITFTSRQAAVAARTCLSDGRGGVRWVAMPDIPTPPLADSPPFDRRSCRNCCRPVTMNINSRQKCMRRWLATTLLALIFVFYTIPLTLATSLVSPAKLVKLFPNIDSWNEYVSLRVVVILSGILSAAIRSGFFASCPMMFKAIANFGSGANSVLNAQYKALQYYWWFMLVTGFSGTLLATMAIRTIATGIDIGYSLRSVLSSIALAIPSEIAASWLNWILFRFTITLPMNYILQFNTFLFHILGWYCCSRLMRGGGPGGPTPYRIYVDSGVVMLCTLALAPASPLIAPAALAYFVVCEPVLRRNLIFVYRPIVDAGGCRWPFLSDMMIHSLVFSSILLAWQMALKRAFGPLIVASLAIIPVLIFQQFVRENYLRAYNDLGLLQASFLDGWDHRAKSTMQKREDFRRFLVDAHKASYIPVPVAGADTDRYLTVEPAVVVPLETDDEEDSPPTSRSFTNAAEPDDESSLRASTTALHQQPGATIRRAASFLRQRKSSRPYGLKTVSESVSSAPSSSQNGGGSKRFSWTAPDEEQPPPATSSLMTGFFTANMGIEMMASADDRSSRGELQPSGTYP